MRFVIPKFLTGNMVQAITVLTVLRMMTKAQTTCNQGMGRVMYERLPNHQLQGFDDDVVRDTSPPFRVLEKCQDLCLRDRTATNNIVRACSSFDFQPGGRVASFGDQMMPEYEESTCYLSREQAAPEGIGNLMLVPNSVHFTEVCLTSNRPERECPSRRYVFERHPRKRLKLPAADLKEVSANNRTDCEDKCLSEFSFVCRSASFDAPMRSCALSRFTRRTHPELLEDDPNGDYLENTCLNAERRCDGLAVFVKEENKRLGGPFEVDILNNVTLEECQSMCMRAEKYFCRSVEFDDATHQCILSEEDSVSQKDDLSIASSPTHHFYDLVCLDNPRGSEYPDNSVTSHLFASGGSGSRRRGADTAFQRYRNSRLGGEFHSEITGRSLSECLDECLRQTSFQCRSAVYSDRFRTCRLSRFNQRDGMRIVYDADYDYYENLMHHLINGDGDMSTGGRPDHGADGWPHRIPGDRYPPVDDRYPPGGDRFRPGGDRYPIGGDRYPDRFGPGGDRYPPDGDRYPPGGDRFPPGGDRYPPGGDRYPPERYPPGSDRYPPGGDKYPPGGDRYPPGGDRFPPGGDRYPPGGDRFPPGGDRYPPGSDRYPPGPDRFRPPYEPYDPYWDPYYDSQKADYPSDRYPNEVGSRYPPDLIPGGKRPLPPPPAPLPPTGTTDRDRFWYRDHEREIPGRGDRYPIGWDRYPGGSGGTHTRYPVTPAAGVDPLDKDRYPPRIPPPPQDGNRLPPYYPPGKDRYPPDRYPLDRDKDRYPPIGLDRDRGRYPAYYPGGGDRTRYPLDRYPADRYSPSDRDRFLTDRGRYPGYPDRYPTDRDRYPLDRYPVDRYPIDRYPSDRDRYPLDRDRGRYPAYYPGDRDRYPMDRDRDRYPVGGRIPIDRYPGPSRLGPDRLRPDRYGPDRVGTDRYGPLPPPPPAGGYGSDRYGPAGIAPDRFGPDRYGPDRYGPDRYGPDRYGAGPGNGFDNTLGPYGGDGFGGLGPVRPFSSRCDEGENFKQVGTRQRVRRPYIRRAVSVPSLAACQRECVEAHDFICRSFNYRDSTHSSLLGGVGGYDRASRLDGPGPGGYGAGGGGPGGPPGGGRDNCELSDRDSRDLIPGDPSHFDSGAQGGGYEYYERSTARGASDGDCLDVSQVCNEDGMEFTLRTAEGFVGRIYTYGHYDRCFFRGNGGTVNVLRISGAQGYPECGTLRYGDTMTNIVVVQFSDNVQTGKDKRFNLTCMFRGPGEAIVTSGYIGAGSGSPIPIEYLPAENSLSSKVRLMILYQGRPTTTIAVGDPLTFRLEAQDGYNYVTDIFATNVVARDPYSGRSVQLIDRYGCPVDNFVFPELDRLRDGDSLEARFNAFKIPESNFLVFEATVRTCRDGCQPAYCATGHAGRSEPSFGRRRRRRRDVTASTNGTSDVIADGEEVLNSTGTILDSQAGGQPGDGNEGDVITEEGRVVTGIGGNIGNKKTGSKTKTDGENTDHDGDENEEEEDDESELPEQVREMIEVFESREELQQEARRSLSDTSSGAAWTPLVAPESVCLTSAEYRGFVTALVVLLTLLMTVTMASGYCYRRYWHAAGKNSLADRSSPLSGYHHGHNHNVNQHSSNARVNNMALFSAPGLQKPFAGRAMFARTVDSTGRNLGRATSVSLLGGSTHHLLATLDAGEGGAVENAADDSPLRSGHMGNMGFDDPSEPIYTDPSLFERSRSLRSLDMTRMPSDRE